MAQFDFDGHASSAELGRNGRVDVSWTFSDISILLQATGIPFHSYGNPAAERTATPQNYEVQIIYRGGTNEAGSEKTPVGLGPVGFWLNGVAVFSPSAGGGAPAGYSPVKGYSYNASFEAGLELGYNFGEDLAGGHPAPGRPDFMGNPTGVYHYHDFSFGSAWLNGKGATDGSKGIPDASAIGYLGGSLRHEDGHSKILGWALDGFPIYGPWGYSNALDTNTTVRRMATGYILKGPSYRGTLVNNLTVYPMGIFVEDYQWSQQGDLDRHNGRYCFTPDFPDGTYAYFVTVDDQDKPVFPYVLGNTFYGTPTGQTAGQGQPVNLLQPLAPGEAVSEKAASVGAAATIITNRTNQVPDIITWVTPKGNLGTFKENAELSVSLKAASPVVDNVPAAGFDPRLSIVTNGNGEFEAIVPSTKHKIAFKYKPGRMVLKEFPDPLGLVLHGSFPNPVTPTAIKPTPFDIIYPYRGGRNEGAANAVAAAQGQIGISVVGIPLFGYAGRFVAGDDNTVYQVNTVEANSEGRDSYGGWPDKFGLYRYQDSSFVSKNAWSRIPKFQAGYTWQDGHSKIIGWAADGYPIYGPYGYVNQRDVGAVQLMVSGWKLRKRPDLKRPIPVTAVVTRGTKRTYDVTVNISTGIYPGMILEGGSWPIGSVWVENVNGYVVTLNQKVTLELNTYIRVSWEFGALVQDWEFSSPPGTTLDRHNGRFCITPEFPGGTYAYFATQDANGVPQFPYIVGPDFKGDTAIQEDPPISGVADLSGTKTVSGLTYTVISGELPKGTQLYRTTGIIYGNPVVIDARSNVPRKYEFTVRAQNSRGKIADRAFSISINNILAPTLNDAADPVTNTVDLGTYFDSEILKVQLNYTEVNPNATLNWSVSKGIIPEGLTLTQTGMIQGFALAPRAAGAAGTSGYDKGVFDQYVWDFEGATLTKTYKFTIRLYDGVQFTERKYKMTILAKSFFRADNNILRADSDDVKSESGVLTSRTIFRADKDGFIYPTMITDPVTVPIIKQDRAFAFKFDAYYPNPNYKIRYQITNSPVDEFGERGFDSIGFDSSVLALPGGLTLDQETGWITGSIGIIEGLKRSYDFQIRAWVEIPISLTEAERRYSNAVQFRLQILSAAANQIIFSSPANLGIIDNGRISTLQIAAAANDGQELRYTLKSTMKALITANPDDQRIVSGMPSRMPQGLSLLPSGRISGRTTFDYYSMDRNKQAEIFLDKKSTTVDAIYTFVVEARTLDNTSFQDKTFTLRVRNINIRPFENLYMRSLNSPDLRRLFHSILDDTDLAGIVYRPDDPWFGIPDTLSFLAVPGLKADTPANYVTAMAKNHYNKVINFGELKTAVALDGDLNPIYEVLYVEVKEPGDPMERSDAINRVYKDIADVSQSLTVESNTLENMKSAMVTGVGYEYQGALPRWMVNLQPDTNRSIGFVRAVVLAYTNPGQIRKLKVAFLRSLLRGTFGFNSIFNQFSFVADRYEWDRTLSVNYNASLKRFKKANETSFDISAALDVIDKGPWLVKNSDTSADLNSITHNGSTFAAVGKNNTLILSRRGDRWDPVMTSVDLGYAAAVRNDISTGVSVLTMYSGQTYSIGDEILQQPPFTSARRAYITAVDYVATVAANNVVTANTAAQTIYSAVSNVIPAGTSIELQDENGATYDTTLNTQAEIGDIYLNIDNAQSLKKGLSIYIKGLDRVLFANLSSADETIPSINLGSVTTNVIAAGTTILLDDQAGNVYSVITANVTNAAVSNVYVVASAPVMSNVSAQATALIPTIAGLEGRLQDVAVNVTIGTTTTSTIQKDAEIAFSVRITEPSAKGSSVVYLSNTDRISVRSDVKSSPITATTLPVGGWNNNPAATINKIQAVVSTDAIQGTLVNNMTVLGPYLPQGTTVANTFVRGSLTYINLSFPSTVQNVPSLGSTVIGNDIYTVRLDKPLKYPLAVGTELRFDDFSGDPQTLVMDIAAEAGTANITFGTPIGRSVAGGTVKLKGLKNRLATVANVNTLSNSSLYLNNVSTSAVEFDIPAGATLNFWDSQGNVTYITSEAVPAGSALVKFTTPIFSTLVGTQVKILGFPTLANITAVNPFAYSFTIDQPVTHVIPANSNISVYSRNTGISYLTNTSAIQVGQKTFAFTVTPNPLWAGPGNAVVSVSGIEIGTVVQTTSNSNIILSGPANATIKSGYTLQLSDGVASVEYLVTSVTGTSTRIPINRAPTRSLYDANVRVLGIPAGYTVASKNANSIVLSGPTTSTLPAGTILEFDDSNGHIANLVTAYEYATGVTSIELTTPAATALTGSRVPVTGNAIFSFNSIGVVDTGTTVISKTREYITLSKPLLTDIEVGFDENFTYGVTNSDYNQVRWLNNRWVVVGNKAMVLSQDENGAWDQRFAYPYGDLTAVGYGDGLYVTVGSTGLILTSEDLDSWEVQATNTTSTHRGISYNNGKWYLVSDEGFVQFSTDGKTWTDITADVWGLNTKRGLRAVKYLNGNWYMVGDGGTVLVSTNNGNTWNVYNAGTSARLNDILFSQGILIAVGNSGVVCESRDGTSWEVGESGIKLNLNAITTDGAVSLTTGPNGLVLASSGFYVVDFAVRGISFEMFNNNSLEVLTNRGYRVQDGQTCIWAQQEKFSVGEFRGPQFENDGWNNYETTFDNPNFDNVAFDTKAVTTVLVTNPLPIDANLAITNMLGISVGDYVTVGSYKIGAGVRVTAVYPLENRITLSQSVIATQGEVVSFYNPVGYDTKSYVNGFAEHAKDPNIINQRAGIWRCNVSTDNIVTMSFVRPIDIGQLVLIKSENTKLFYDQNLAGNQTVPSFSIVEQELSRPARTTFDGSGTRFSNNRDQYQEPGALAKYMKFPRIGVFE